MTDASYPAEAAAILAKLHPLLSGRGYLKNHPDVVVEWRDELTALSSWLDEGPHPAARTVRERSLEIFGDEKALYSQRAPERGNTSLPRLLRRLKIGDKELGIARGERFTPTAEEGVTLLDGFVRRDLSTRRFAKLVISENLDPWKSMRRVAGERGSCDLFGTSIDGAVFGEGYAAVSSGALDRFEQGLGFGGIITYLWWGDIDWAGLGQLREAQLLPGKTVVPFAEAYERMLRMADLDSLPADTSQGERDQRLAAMLADELDPSVRGKLKQVLERGLRVPQELARVGAEKAEAPDSWRGDERETWRPSKRDRGVAWDDSWDEQNVFRPGEENYDPLEWEE